MANLVEAYPVPLARAAAWRRTLEKATVREILMGAQDNLTNVLAVVLGVTIGTGRLDFIALAGLSAGIAEAVSMGGVLYSATRAEQRWGTAGHATAGPDSGRLTPAISGFVTFAAALVAGLLPLAPFALFAVGPAVVASTAVSVLGLFALGAATGRLAGDGWWQAGMRLLVVAGIAAVAAASVGALLQVA